MTTPTIAAQLNIDAGSGNVDFIGAVGGTNAIDTLTVSDAADVTIQNVGGGSAGVDNALSITNSGTTIFNGTTYNANSQNYSATTGHTLAAGSTTNFSSSSDQIQFQNGAITLGSGSNLSISTNGAAAVLGAITGTGSETVNISTGSVSAGSINVDAINSVGAVTLESGTDSLVTSSIIAAGTVDLDGDAAITLGGLIQTTEAMTSKLQMVPFL